MIEYDVLHEIKLLINKVENVKSAGWIPSIIKGPSGVGRTFENSLGLSENSLEIADYKGIVEIKTKCIRNDNLYKYINLFSAVPDSYLFETKRIAKTYGYPHKNNKDLKVFNFSVYSNVRLRLEAIYLN